LGIKENEMDYKSRNTKIAAGLLSAMLAGWLLVGCSQTAAPAPNIIQRVQGDTPAPPPPSGFLGSDYSLLKPPAEGSDQKAQLAYADTSANFTSYGKIIIAPVTFWGDKDSTLSAEDQQTLCDYFYDVLKQEFSKNFTLVNEPGPGVAKLTVALTDANSAVPVLRTISLIVPQARTLSTIKLGLTGTYAFVGSATGEAKLTDSVSGQLLAAWSDRRVGSGAFKNVTVWQWGDAENAMNYWANGLDQRLVTLGVQHSSSTAAD
jgi:Protein of unknown function (DUF3313)